jgi:hypothetical protein
MEHYQERRNGENSLQNIIAGAGFVFSVDNQCLGYTQPADLDPLCGYASRWDV